MKKKIIVAVVVAISFLLALAFMHSAFTLTLSWRHETLLFMFVAFWWGRDVLETLRNSTKLNHDVLKALRISAKLQLCMLERIESLERNQNRQLGS